MEMIKGGVKTVSNLRIWETKDGTLTISIPIASAKKIGLKYGDRVSVIKEP